MSRATGTGWAWRALVVLAYFARAWSAGVALDLEVRPLDNPYASVDPHGFGLGGLFLATLLGAVPVLWLMLQGPMERPAALRSRAFATTVVLVIGTPMLLQLSYRELPFAALWPIVLSCLVWFALVVGSALAAGHCLPSVHVAHARRPLVAWLVVLAFAAAKLALLAATFAYA